MRIIINIKLIFFLKFILTAAGVLVSVAFLTLIERKVLGMVGIRLSPLKMRIVGVLQPIGDALKLAFKLDSFLSYRFNLIYVFIGSMFLSFSLSIWIFTRLFYTDVIYIKISLLIILFIITFRTLSILLVGWLSLSKYPLIGAIRSATQAISYESIIILIFLILAFFIGCYKIDLNILKINIFFIIPIMFLFWLFTSLAEIGRTPYDFSEGERELVSGFNTEFGSTPFSLIFLSEYSNILFFGSITSLIFFSIRGLIYFLIVVFWFIWIRSVLPRSRFDYLIDLAWKFFIPLITLYVIYLVYETFF